MKKISGTARGLVRCAGLAAAAVLVLSAAPQQRAEALSLASPGTLPAAKYASEGMTIEVRGGHGGHGGGGFRGGGGFHGARIGGGGMAFRGGGYRAAHIYRGGGYRAAHIYRGGGYRYSGLRYGGHRYAYHRHHRFHRHFHRRFYYAPSYYYYHHRRCRIVWTYYGPRKICRYRPWYRHHYYW